MKKFSKITMAAVAVMLCGTLYAQSATNVATAGTVSKDGDKYADVLGFKNTDYEKNFIFAKIGTQDTVSLGFATKQKFGTLALAYEGNFWADKGTNNAKVLYGYNQFGAMLGFHSYQDQTLGVINAPLFGIGYTILDGKMDFALNGEIGITSVESGKTTIDYLFPSAVFTFDYSFYNKENLSMFAGLNVGFDMISIDAGSKSSLKTDIGIKPFYGVNANLGEKIKYSGLITVPIKVSTYSVTTTTKSGSSTKDADPDAIFNIVIRNGFSVKILKGAADLNMGMEISLPTMDLEMVSGTLSNAYYLGSTFYLGNALELDTYAKIFNGKENASLNDIWNTELGLTASVKF